MLTPPPSDKIGGELVSPAMMLETRFFLNVTKKYISFFYNNISYLRGLIKSLFVSNLADFKEESRQLNLFKVKKTTL